MKLRMPKKKPQPTDDNGIEIAEVIEDVQVSPPKKVRIKGKLLVILALLFIAPLVLTIMFSLTQTLEQANNVHQVCRLTENDYLTYLAVDSARRSLIDFMPFKFWGLTSIFIAEVCLGLIVLYELAVIYFNKKNPKNKKESLFKNNKLTMFNFFVSLLALSAFSAQYMDTTQAFDKQKVEFVDERAKGRENFFLICSLSGKIELSNKSEIIDNRLSKNKGSSETKTSNSNDTAKEDIVYE